MTGFEINLRELFFEYKYTIIVISGLLLLILLMILIAKVWDNANYTKNNQNEIDEITEIKDILITLETRSIEQTKLLERIAKALETEDEPYIITKEDL